MNPKITIALLVVLAFALAGLGLWRAGVFTPAPTEPAIRTLSPTYETLVVIDVFEDGQPTLHFERSDPSADWIGSSGKVQQWTVAALVRSVAGLEYVRRFAPAGPEGLDDSLTGLDVPLWTVTLTDVDGAKTTLVIGQRTAAGSATAETYLRVDEQTDTFVVARDLADLLRRPAEVYRDLTVLELAKDRIDRITIDGPTSYVLARRDDAWRLLEPIDAAVDAEAFQTLLNTVAHVTAGRILADEPTHPANFGLDAPLATISIHLAGEPVEPDLATSQPAVAVVGETHTLVLGQRRGGVVTARVDGQGPVVLLPTTLLDTLQPALDDLRQARLLENVSDSDVTAITLRRPVDSVALTRSEDGSWQVSADALAGPAHATAVAMLLDCLDHLDVLQWLEPEVAQLAGPFETEIVLQAAGRTQTLEIGTPNADQAGRFVRLGDRVAVVSEASLAKLAYGVKAYWSRQLWEAELTWPVTKIDLDRPDGQWTLMAGESGWELTTPADTSADEEAVKTLATALQCVYATDIVQLGGSLEDLPDHGPVLRATLTQEETLHVDTVPDISAEPATKTVTLCFARAGQALWVWREGQDVLVVGTADVNWAQAVEASLVVTSPAVPAEQDEQE